MGHVTFPAVGRCGNFLFEAATAIAYSLRHNLRFTVPTKTTDNFWSKLYLQHLADASFDIEVDTVEIFENGHEYQPIEFREEWRDMNIIIHGYRQSALYFDDYRNEILYLFQIPYNFKPNYVGVHVRRTDYTHLLNKHPQIGKEWYQQAMSKFEGYRFLFFSDDLQWCLENFGDRSDVEFSTGADEIEDLSLASSCEHNIISSSTFGWWQAYLNRNENKKVIIPRLWFVENYSLSTKDIVPSTWIKL